MALTGEQAIDQIIQGVYRLPLLDADNADRRARVLEWLQEIAERYWYARPWAWRRGVSDPFTLVAGVLEVPSDFQAVGETRRGGVWVKSTGYRLEPVPEETMRDLLNRPGGINSSDPTAYSIYGLGASDGLLNLVCNTSANTPLILAYEKAPPTIADSASDTGLVQIPGAYHQSAVMPALRAYARQRNGDDVDPELFIQRGIALMAKAERPDADTPKQAPSFFDGCGGYR